MSNDNTVKQTLRSRLLGAWELIEFVSYPSTDPSNRH